MTQTRTGLMTITAKGVGYLKNPLFETDLEIAPDLVNTALQGDEVEVEEIDKKDPQFSSIINRLSTKPQARVLRIIKRAKTNFVGTLEEDQGYFFMIPDDKRMYRDILIPADKTMGAKHGQKVYAAMDEWTDGKSNPTGRVLKVIGEKGNNDAEMESIVLEKGFDVDFPTQVVEEAHELEATERNISANEIAKRRDMRGTFTATIDPYDAKDFDDALSIKKLDKTGNNGEAIYEVGVHIADVSHYVRPGTALDAEARKRSFSVYLVDRTIPMLPHVLSNDVCSLNPNEDKLTFSAVFEINLAGHIYSRWFGRTVIHSDKRFTYENAQEVLTAAGEKGIKELDQTGTKTVDGKPIDALNSIEHGVNMVSFNTIAYALRREKEKAGAIDFETVEIKFKLDETGKPIEVIKKERMDTHRLVEEFMLLANREVAEYIFTGGDMQKLIKIDEAHVDYEKAHNKQLEGTPNKGGKMNLGVYRIHDVPDREKIGELSTFLKALGYDLNVHKQITPRDMQKLLREVAGDPNESLIKTATIRSMAKAIYSTKNIGHFGLAFTYYTHFTSPIRRYPDLVVHRILQDIIDGRKMDDRDAANFTKICADSSEQELKAADAERQSIKYKQIEYMLPRLGQTFKGKISGVTEWGLYVTEENTLADGMIKARDLKDDFYEFDAKRYCLVGQKTKKKYTLGDPIEFKIVAGDLERKTLDCVLA